MATTSYITQEGDRWDLIAWKAYGDCSKDQIKKIQDANPYVNVVDYFTSGVALVIPILEESEEVTLVLPPWKR